LRLIKPILDRYLNNEYLKQHTVDDEIITKLNEKATNLIKKQKKKFRI